jgi:N-acetylmuramoyl-L-alanine amidase
MKIISAAFTFFFICILAQAEPAPTPFRVVIDPGHGGEDEGAVFFDKGRKITEKEITLLIAKEAATQLRARGFMVFLTRDRDRELPLPARTALANQLGADVFLSVHLNSKPSSYRKDAEGIETYILNNATDASSRRLAQLENSVLGGSAHEIPAEVSPQPTDVALILKDLRLDANLAESKRLACAVQENLISATSREKDRGVKQALFHVLLGADMPSILVEAGFLTNTRDRSHVQSKQGQRSIGTAIASAVEQYRKTKNTHTALALLSRCKVHGQRTAPGRP